MQRSHLTPDRDCSFTHTGGKVPQEAISDRDELLDELSHGGMGRRAAMTPCSTGPSP
ncbi:hypothetical protein SAMN05428954_1542 [Streptomyces sp. 2112.3]|nr:hypothetical protein SAMN05428954_1542 [Streptomyces sp. 2112.3]